MLEEVRYDSIFSFKFSPRPNTPARDFPDALPEEEKGRRLAALQQKQREIQLSKNETMIGSIQEVLVEGRNPALNQWVGRTTDNRVLNFTLPPGSGGDPAPERNRLGTYAWVRVTKAGPNSLVGEMLPASQAEEAELWAAPVRTQWPALPILS